MTRNTRRNTGRKTLRDPATLGDDYADDSRETVRSRYEIYRQFTKDRPVKTFDQWLNG